MSLNRISSDKLREALKNIYPCDNGLPILGGTVPVFSLATILNVIDCCEEKPAKVITDPFGNGNENEKCCPKCGTFYDPKDSTFNDSHFCPDCGCPIEW